MTWLLWRQHRRQAAIAGGALGALVIALLLTGWHMADAYHSALATCQANGTCGDLNLFQGYGALVDLVQLTLVVPLLIGVSWGTTLVGREIETGTHTLVWTQGVSRRRWLTSKLVLLLAAATGWGAAVSAIVTWWSGILNSLNGNRFDIGKFDLQGIVPVAYSLFAAGLGVAAGAVIRRVLPAIATTVVGFVGVRLLIANFVRPHYASALVADVPFDQPVNVSSGAWTLSKYVELHGQALGGAWEIPSQCRAAAAAGTGRECLTVLGYRYVVHYQPAGRYWPFQFIESGLFVLLAAILVALTVVVMRRRDA